jgi:hypothetical protein
VAFTTALIKIMRSLPSFQVEPLNDVDECVPFENDQVTSQMTGMVILSRQTRKDEHAHGVALAFAVNPTIVRGRNSSKRQGLPAMYAPNALLRPHSSKHPRNVNRGSDFSHPGTVAGI